MVGVIYLSDDDKYNNLEFPVSNDVLQIIFHNPCSNKAVLLEGMC